MTKPCKTYKLRCCYEVIVHELHKQFRLVHSKSIKQDTAKSVKSQNFQKAAENSRNQGNFKKVTQLPPVQDTSIFSQAPKISIFGIVFPLRSMPHPCSKKKISDVAAVPFIRTSKHRAITERLPNHRLQKSKLAARPSAPSSQASQHGGGYA